MSSTDPWQRLQSLRTFGVPPRPLNRPHFEASSNLIAKAVRVWASDYDRAVSYVKRGAQFAYDPEELDYPVRWEAHMALFADVTDAAEDADAGDERWLDAALDLLDSADEVARVDLADVLRVTSKDWRLTHREDRRIAAATAAVPRADDPAPGLTPEQVLDLTLPLVRATVAYRRALSAS